MWSKEDEGEKGDGRARIYAPNLGLFPAKESCPGMKGTNEGLDD